MPALLYCAFSASLAFQTAVPILGPNSPYFGVGAPFSPFTLEPHVFHGLLAVSYVLPVTLPPNSMSLLSVFPKMRWRAGVAAATVALFTVVLGGWCYGQERGGGRGYATLSISPAYAYISAVEPYGSFRLSNNGTAGMEVVVSAEYGVVEADSAGENTSIVVGRAGLLGDLSERLTFYPERVILEPGSEWVVRYMVEGADALPDAGYIALMHFKMQERAAVRSSEVPALATAINIEYSLVAPLVLLSSEGAPELSAQVLGTTDSTVTLLVTNDSPHPFVGGVNIMVGERALGRMQSAVFTRRRIEIPLSAPLEDGVLTLTFDTDYPGLDAVLAKSIVPPFPLEIRY